MAEDAVVEEQPPTPPGKSSSLGKMLLIVVLALVSSAGGGFMSFMLISRTLKLQTGQGEKAPDKPKEEEDVAKILEKSAVLPLEPFVVNLADADAARYLRIKISLMIDDKLKLPAVIENQALQLKVRDIILQSLTNKTSQQLIHEDGKNKLRHEIQDKIAVYFREPKLVDVM